MNRREAHAVCKRVGQLRNEASRETRKAAKKELLVTSEALKRRVTNAGYTCACTLKRNGDVKHCTAAGEGLGRVARRRARCR